MGDLKVGDRVFDENGVPCYVVAKSPVWKDRPVYRVTTDDGDTIVADEQHEWRARLCGKRPAFKIHSTATLAKKRQKRAMVERQGPLQLPDVDLPIDPYLLGVWLGDGTTGDGTITQSSEDIEWMRWQFEAMGHETTDRADGNTFGVSGLKAKLRDLGVLGNKHVPASYLRASELQRLALLRGLIDTDGYVAKDGQVEFCNTNLALAEQVRELVHSLGRKASLIYGRATLDGKDCGPKYRVMFYMADAARMPRKWAKCRNTTKTPHRYVSAEYVGTADTACIEVSSESHMYLCGRSMLPTHNSIFRSMWFPAWYLGTFPDRRVILASYNAEFAAEWGMKVRDILEQHGEEYFGVRVRPDRRAIDNWGIAGHDGGMQTCGVGGSLTGRGADLLLIDDPVKDADEALSPTMRQRNWDWYVSAAESRIEPGGACCLTMTPWHPDDLGGRLMESERARWDVLRLPALGEITLDAAIRRQRTGYYGLVGEPDPLGREEGQALWPARYPEPYFHAKARQDPFWFDALYQCSPRMREGGIFKYAWFEGKTGVLPPTDADYVRAWDTAASDGKGDYTVGVLMARQGLSYFVVDVERFRLSAGERDDRIVSVSKADDAMYRGRYRIYIEQAPSGGGKAEGLSFVQKLAGLPIQTVPAEGNKERRAIPFASQCQGGNVRLVQGSWIEPYLDELASFTGSGRGHDDQVDASSLAFSRLALGGGDRECASYSASGHDALAGYGEVTFL